MKKRIIYLFGILNISILVLTWLVFINRFYGVDIWSVNYPTVEFIVENYAQINLSISIICIITIILNFNQNLQYTIFVGSIGLIVYFLNEIFVIFIFTKALELRIFVLIYYFVVQFFLIYIYFNPSEKEIEVIRKTIIDLSSRYTKTHIKEFSEKTKSDRDLIMKVAEQMISNKEINAELFRSSKKIAFYTD